MMVASYRPNSEAFAASKPRLWVAKKDLGLYFHIAPDGKRFAVMQLVAPEHKGPGPSCGRVLLDRVSENDSHYHCEYCRVHYSIRLGLSSAARSGLSMANYKNWRSPAVLMP